MSATIGQLHLNGTRRFVLPAEAGPHLGTIMAWPTASSIIDEAYAYHGADVCATRAEVASVAKAIAEYEHVHLFVNDRTACMDSSLQSAKDALGKHPNVTTHHTPNVHSLWARDTSPLFVRSQQGPVENRYSLGDDPGLGMALKCTSSGVAGLIMGFNNWGRKNVPNPDMFLAASASQALDRSALSAPFIAEGGAIEVDGEGTLIATESSILNPNRNPGIGKAEMERYFAENLGIKKTIWIPGVKGADITDDHIDCLVRFTVPGTVLLSKAFSCSEGDDKALKSYHDAKRILSETTDAQGRKLKIIEIPEPDPSKVLNKDYDLESGSCVSYVNYLVVNGGIVMAKFGDSEKDADAARIISEQYPDRVVEQVHIHQLAMQGGGIHCATMQVPL